MKNAHAQDSWVIISLGGSLIVPDAIAVTYLRKLRALLLRERNHRYVIVCGGGATSRRYIAAAKAAGARPTNRDLDWIGIRSLNLNADLVRLVFGSAAHPLVLFEPKDFRSALRARVIVSGALEPGSSSDLNAVRWAVRLGARRVINLTNIDAVYSANPKKHANAVPMHDLSWSDYRRIVGGKWTPGRDSPFDPVAARAAARAGLTVDVLDGTRLEDVRNALQEKSFHGTVIRP